jgi:hypothetical protein
LSKVNCRKYWQSNGTGQHKEKNKRKREDSGERNRKKDAGLAERSMKKSEDGERRQMIEFISEHLKKKR